MPPIFTVEALFLFAFFIVIPGMTRNLYAILIHAGFRSRNAYREIPCRGTE
ncbi:MAG: hypothetical protein JWO44_2042 [Bacteroidetes bacterium]|nr:hypothetical protein [Bacteroidota bacterium]